MKLIITIVQDQKAPRLLDSLTKRGLKVTKLASTGGFLKQGNTTLIIGVEDNEVGVVMEIVKDATVFVLDVERFEKY